MWYFSIITIVLMLSPVVQAADSQFSVNKCAALEDERMAIQAKMRRGYDVSEYNWLNGRELKLFNLQARHCVNPIPDEQAAAAYLAPDQQQRQRQQQAEITTDFPMMQANNAVFTGAKAKAWDAFYQMPVQCRVHQQQAEDFVFCAEDKLRQRQAFLQQWSQHQRDSSVGPGNSQHLARTIKPADNHNHSAALQNPVPGQPAVLAKEPVMKPLQIQQPHQLQQLSGLGLGALLVFLWMSWWLWRR